ncbi:hypothetical protein ACFLTP_11090, partial [Chloroflexota bacterium]
CAIESKDQLFMIAEESKKAGAHILRGVFSNQEVQFIPSKDWGVKTGKGQLAHQHYYGKLDKCSICQ